MSGHVYDPDPDGFCRHCQQQAAYCTGRPRPVPRTAKGAPKGAKGAEHTPLLPSLPSGEPAGRKVVVTLASQIKPRPVRWLWPGRIPAGALTLLAGREGIGKSLVTVSLAAQLTRGTLPGARHGKPSRVMFATSEDAWEFTMGPAAHSRWG